MNMVIGDVLVKRRRWLSVVVFVSVFAASPAAVQRRVKFSTYGVGSSVSSVPAFVVSSLQTGICAQRRERERNRCQQLHDRILEDEVGKPARRRIKKNKYAKFSKTDKKENDPFEAMVSDSLKKVKKIEVEKARKQNRRLPLDEEEMQLKRQEKRERNKLQFPETKTIDPYDPTTYGYTELGKIVGSHGVHGFLKVSTVTEFAERLCKPGTRHLKAHNRRCPREVQLLEGRHRLGNEYLVKLEGIGDRDAAKKLRGSVLYALQKERPCELKEDEFLISDLIGLDVYLEKECDEVAESKADNDRDNEIVGDRGKSFVGTVGGILLGEDMCSVPGLGQDMLEIVLPRGRGGTPSWRDEMVLVPFVPQIVPTVDIEEGAIYIAPPAGLLDLAYVKEEKFRIKGFLPPAKEDDQ